MLTLEVFTAVVVYPLLVFLLVEIFVGIIWGEIDMFGFICAVLSAVNVFVGITEIYKPEPNQYWIALHLSMAWLVALIAIKDIVSESK